MNAEKPLFTTLLQQLYEFEKENGFRPRAFILPEDSLAILERELMNTSITLTTSPVSGKTQAIFYGVPVYESQDIINLVYDF